MDEGLRCLRKLTGGSEDILRISVSDIIYSRGKHFFFSPKNGLLLSFHPNQWKEGMFLLVRKKLVKWLPSGKAPVKHGWSPKKHVIFIAINKNLDRTCEQGQLLKGHIII